MTFNDIIDDYHARLPIKTTPCHPENRLYTPSKLILKMGLVEYVNQFNIHYVHTMEEYSREQVIIAFTKHASMIAALNKKYRLK